MPDSQNTPESPLERLRRKLYAPPAVASAERTALSSTPSSAAEGWAPEPVVVKAPKKPGLSGSALFLIFGVGFFALAGIVSGIVLFLGGRSLSSDNLTISIEGPTTVSGGQETSFFIAIENNNPTVAEHPVLSVTFPEGTFEAGNASVPLTYYSEKLADIAAGEVRRIQVRAAFFGEENARLNLPITVEYATGQSNATFVSKKSYALVISTAPVTLTLTTLSEIAPGQPLTLSVVARSNATTPLENVAVEPDYPFGFTVSTSEPELTNGLFRLGTLAPGEEKEVRITGIVSGSEGEERIFRFSVGSLSSASANSFSTPYSSADASLYLAKAFLAVSLDVNRSDKETSVITSSQENIATLSWENTLKSSIQDGKIEVKLSGEALDSGSVQVANGFYSSASRTVVFDRDTDKGLASLAPGDDGGGSFTFRTKTGSALKALRNPTITMTVSVSGRRLGQGSVPETVTSNISRSFKVATDLSLTARSVRTEGPFTNTGPWPPVADTETTYTILLAADNTVNTAANAAVTTTLPSYVRYTGQATNGVTYNETTRQVTWTIGDMGASAAFSSAFQVALLPSVSQKGTSPVLTGQVTLAGYDRFAGVEVKDTATAPSTRADTDPSFQSSFGIVK
jgi:hypothetical protein